jgi:general stress protein 26
MAQAHDHEMVSIYPFTEAEIDALMAVARECVLMWSTRDGWPVGVVHAFVWHAGRIWLTFTAQRHRAAAIRRDNRVSVNVSSVSYPEGAPPGLPHGAITFKGRGEFIEDRATIEWFYRELSRKLNPGNPAGEEAFYRLLDSPLRVLLAVTPEKRIMYSSDRANRHRSGEIEESELGERLAVDRERMNEERLRRGLPPR